jgi:hypothetical protein
MSADPMPELDKLGHQLGVDASELDFLAGVDITDLRELRTRIGEALFQADRHHFTRMAALAKAVPVAVVAKITVLALPPLLAARTSELFEPKKAVELVLRLPEHYLADVSAAMDPSRSPDVVAAMPPETVSAVGVELAGRGEWVTMGAFVSYVNSPALRETVGRLDGEQLLRIGYVLDDESRLGEISDMLTDQQLDEMLAAAHEQQLWRELDDLLAKLDDDRAGRLIGRYAAAGADLHAALAAGSLSPAARDRLAGA